MPNRILKESICTSESIDSLTLFDEVFFYRLIVNCDDYGRMDARPAILKSRLFPLKADVKDKQIVASLEKLSKAGIVSVYGFKQKPYIQLVSWDKHQTIRNKKSKFPEMVEENEINIQSLLAPNIQLKSVACNCKQMNANVHVIQSNPIQSESESESESNPIREKTDYEKAIDDFMEFCKKIKAPMTERAITLLHTSLDSLAGDDETKIMILNQSILNGWKGVFELKSEKGGYKQNEQHNPEFITDISEIDFSARGDL